ncbi:MAG TPA: DUF6489 family protein [Rhizomicrobium sp.]|nr:DUF6489 family protein [Rhizomicrobium sp.]
MKVNIELDMTPEEARRLMGLPDLTGLQERMGAELERRMKAALEAADPAQMMKAWFGGEGLEQFQRFWAEAARPRPPKAKS